MDFQACLCYYSIIKKSINKVNAAPLTGSGYCFSKEVKMQLSKVFYPCAELFIPSFYRIPRPLFFHPELLTLSNDAKLLYSLLLDRLSLSISNSWFDETGQIYVYFTLNEVQSSLNCRHQKATSLFNELEKNGLINRKTQGLGKPDRIYVHILPEMEVYQSSTKISIAAC